MKNRFILGLMTLCLGFLLCLPALTAASITDTIGHWAEVHIEKWINDGLITGYPAGQFKPDNSITRAELVSLVNRAFKIPESNASHNFSDVKPSDWFYDDVMSGQAAGYISGYTDGTFKPNNPITRQEAAALLAKLLNLGSDNASAMASFGDYQSIGQWAEAAVNGVVTHGIMNGFPDKTFRAQKNITRAETVVTLDKALACKPEKISGINGIVKLNNQPVKGAVVKVFPKDSHESLKETVTGEDGTFTFAVPDGQYELTAVRDKNAGYAGPITVAGGSAAGTQEVLLNTGTRVTGKLVDKSGRALANIPYYFTTNPTFSGKTDNNGGFSIVLPARGPDGQLLSYTGFFFHNGTRQDFASNQQFSEDTNLGQLQTGVPGQSSPGGGGGGGSPGDNTPPTWVQDYPRTADITQTGLKLLAKTNESGTAYYVVLADDAVTPTAAEVKNGTDAIKHGQTVLQANTEASITITGLKAGTAYDIYVVAEDSAGNLQTDPVKLNITTAAPDPGDTTPPTVSSASVNGSTLVLTYNENLDQTSVPSSTDFSIKVNGSQQAAPLNVALTGAKVTITLAEPVTAGDTVTISYTPPEASPIQDRAANKAVALTGLQVSNSTGELAAPEIDRTVATNLLASTAFLYSGENPVQTGMAPETIEQKRVAVIRGKVLTRDNTTLPEVRITVLDHPEFGSTLSRSDGCFDMAVNGGGVLTIRYEKDSYITAQRQVEVPWQDFALLPEVVLLQYDSKANTIDLGDATPMQVARGSEVVDADGTRTATLIFPEGVRAEIEMPDGTTRSLSSLKVRATEYSAGDNGPEAMPAILPPNVGYTYCVEYSADEAVAAGAKSVSFSQPIYHYVENFIGFPVGSIVPMGYYDYDQAAWIPSKNGRVIKILAINDGLAELDVDGSEVAADFLALAVLGIYDAERQKLAGLYQPGQELWRVPITHFSPWDCNWPYGPPPGARPPNLPLPRINRVDDPCLGRGSIIEYQNQVLGETAKVFGTPFTLNYRSNRVEGNKNFRSLQIPISLAEIHDQVHYILLEVRVAGQLFKKTFDPSPNQIYLFTWDGKDAYGRPVQGATPINVRVGYVYPAVYVPPSEFEATFGSTGSPGTWSRGARQEIIAWQEWTDQISSWDSLSMGFGGWSLNVHHSYDPNSQTLYLGDGNSRLMSGYVINAVAGDGIGSYGGDGGPATGARINFPMGIAVGPDGSLYIADSWNARIRKVDPDGIISTVAGNGTKGYSGDGGPATKAQINNDAFGVAVGPDGSLYIADTYNSRIRRVGPDGIITTVAGSAVGFFGDGLPAIYARFDNASGLAVAPDGSLYIADTDNHRIRRIGPDGIIRTVAGTSKSGYNGDGISATEAQLFRPFTVALGPDGSLYIADSRNHRIRRVGLDGIITTVAGNGTEGYSGDDGRAIDAQLNVPCSVAVSLDGSLYIADTGNHCIRQVSPDGIITTLTGTGEAGSSGDGSPAFKAQINCPYGVAVGPDGSLYLSDSDNSRVRRVSQPSPGVLGSALVFPSEDGTELFLFDSSGRHQNTVNALTGSDIFRFTYDEQGLLTEVEDAFNNVTRIEREQGQLKEITAPGGQKTYLAVHDNGYLSKIICPLFKEKNLTYTSDGLLTIFSDHKGYEHRFTYDDLGRLIKDEDPAGGYTELSRSERANGHTVNVNTAEGRQTSYTVEYISETIRRTDTDPAGGITVTDIKSDGTCHVTYPDGSVVTMVKEADPRPGMGMLVPVTKESIVHTPAGLASAVTRGRTVELTDPQDLFSITKITDTVSNNGQEYIHTYDINREGQTVTLTTTTPEGRQTQSILDWYGRVTKETIDNLEPVRYTYNEKGHLTRVQQGELSLDYTYDDLGRVAALKDAAGSTFQYEYNGADLLTKLTVPGGQSYSISYDFNGNATKITMPSGAVHEIDYTAVDLAQSYTPPGNSSYQKSYNRDRALKQMTLPGGRSVNYTYDHSGRITGIAYDPASSAFVYNDLTNRAASISRNPDGISYSYLYDGSLVTQMSASVSDGEYGRYSYSYDNNFKLAGFDLDGSSVAMEHDDDGLLTTYGPFSIAHFGPLGAPSQISDGTMSVTYTYDNYGRPTTRTAAVAGNPVYSVDISYDNTGIIKSKTETVNGAVAESTFTYDRNKQLTGVSGGGTESYTYDVNGNRLTDGATYDAQDRLTKLGDVTYQFNADGFLSQRGSDAFDYTAQGELKTVTLTDKTVSYIYDGLGRRVGRSLTTGTEEEPVITSEQYLYGNLGNPFQITAMRDNDGSVSEYYYDHSNCLFAIKQGEVWYYVATDWQGTPRVVSDAAGQAVKVMEYDSYGKLISDSNPAFLLPVGYAGGIADPDTKLVHFGMRDYDPAAGRWTARDPVLFDGQQGNLYVYVRNNPVNLRDPYGLFCIGGSAYVGFGGGGQLCITGEGVSLCGEVGFGIGKSVEVEPFGGLARTGTEVGAQAGISYFGIGPSAELVLDNCGSLKFGGSLNVGPVAAGAEYDFLEGKWSGKGPTVGGDFDDLFKNVSESFSPKVSANAKVYGKGCVRF